MASNDKKALNNLAAQHAIAFLKGSGVAGGKVLTEKERADHYKAMQECAQMAKAAK